jgi:hypothetical protein
MLSTIKTGAGNVYSLLKGSGDLKTIIYIKVDLYEQSFICGLHWVW